MSASLEDFQNRGKTAQFFGETSKPNAALAI